MRRRFFIKIDEEIVTTITFFSFLYKQQPKREGKPNPFEEEL